MSNSCRSTPYSYSVQLFYNNDCFSCGEECGTSVQDSKCVTYSGPNLSCSGIETNDSVQTALQKIDEQICTVTGDYSNYQYNCLTTWLGEAITTEAEFVSAITAYTCEITENLESFTGTTFPSYQSSVAAQFEAIEGPGITCIVANVTPADNLESILSKYCTALSNLNTATSIDAVDWEQCSFVSSTPTTIAEGFDLVIAQICELQNAGATLPTFNNSANCLVGGATDTLEETITSLIDYVCTTQAFDGDAISPGCHEFGDTSLQTIVETIVDDTSSMMQQMPSFSGDFVVEAVDDENPCAGVIVSLATPINQDRFVAATTGDSSPGTLQDKLIAGAGVSLDYITSPGEVIIAASGTADTFEVKANTAGSEGFLDEKIGGGSNTGITINVTYNGGTDKVDIVPTIDASDLFTYLLNTLDSDSELYDLFCEKIAGCPSPCDTPTDVQAVPVNSTSTTTSGV